jgi:hypothetical protein
MEIPDHGEIAIFVHANVIRDKIKQNVALVAQKHAPRGIQVKAAHHTFTINEAAQEVTFQLGAEAGLSLSVEIPCYFYGVRVGSTTVRFSVRIFVVKLIGVKFPAQGAPVAAASRELREVTRGYDTDPDWIKNVVSITGYHAFTTLLLQLIDVLAFEGDNSPIYADPNGQTVKTRLRSGGLLMVILP